MWELWGEAGNQKRGRGVQMSKKNLEIVYNAVKSYIGQVNNNEITDREAIDGITGIL